MLRASKFFGEEDQKRIGEAVAQAEKTTSGEIVPVVATASGDYDRAEDLVGLWFAGIGLVLFWWLMLPPAEAGAWQAPEASLSPLGLVAALFVIVVGFILGALIAANVGWLRRLFASRAQMRRCVEEAAGRIFFEQGVRETRARTGILIYLSLFERVVRVTGDRAIAEKLSDSDWQQVRDLILDGIKQRRAADGMVAGIRRCGELLAVHFPIQPGDVDELHNDLRVMD
jgi:putative membrane protein